MGGNQFSVETRFRPKKKIRRNGKRVEKKGGEILIGSQRKLHLSGALVSKGKNEKREKEQLGEPFFKDSEEKGEQEEREGGKKMERVESENRKLISTGTLLL